MSAQAVDTAVVIVGAGNAGVSLAAGLRRDGHERVTLVDPAPKHRYRPMLNYTATGRAPRRVRQKPMGAVVPRGVELVPEEVMAVDAAARTVTTESGRTLLYGALVLCPGLTPDWDVTPGLRESFARRWAVSAHVPEAVQEARDALAAVMSGTVVFSVPPEPASCSGTVLKAMFIACDTWRRRGVLDQLDVHLVTPYRGVLGLEPVDSRLAGYVARFGITVHDRSVVGRVDHEARTVTVEGPEPTQLADVALAYVTPVSRAPYLIEESGLGDGTAGGLIDVDPETLRHRRHPEVWGLGDAATVDTRPSGGALRRQVDVLARNLGAAGGPLPARYDGYTIMPIATTRSTLLLAEHTRDGAPAPTTERVDLTVPRRATYVFDRYVEPVVYFRWLLRGHV